MLHMLVMLCRVACHVVRGLCWPADMRAGFSSPMLAATGSGGVERGASTRVKTAAPATAARRQERHTTLATGAQHASP